MGLLTTGMVGEDELNDNSAFGNNTLNNNVSTSQGQALPLSSTEYVDDFEEEEPDEAYTPVNEENINTDRRDKPSSITPSLAPSDNESSDISDVSDDEHYGDEVFDHKQDNVPLKNQLNNVQGRLSEYRLLYNDPTEAKKS
jgi:hypothetical protein